MQTPRLDEEEFFLDSRYFFAQMRMVAIGTAMAVPVLGTGMWWLDSALPPSRGLIWYLAWTAILLALLLSPSLAWYWLYRRVPIVVSQHGIVGWTGLGSRYFVAWDQIEDAQLVPSRLPVDVPVFYLKEKNRFWLGAKVPLFVKHSGAFVRAVTRHAGPQNPITKLLQKNRFLMRDVA